MPTTTGRAASLARNAQRQARATRSTPAPSTPSQTGPSEALRNLSIANSTPTGNTSTPPSVPPPRSTGGGGGTSPTNPGAGTPPSMSDGSSVAGTNTSGFGSLRDMSMALSPKPPTPPRTPRVTSAPPPAAPPVPRSAADFERDLGRSAQREINSLNQYAMQAMEALRPRQEERLRETASVNTLTGLAGSTEANRTTEATTKINQRENDLVRAETAAKVQSILSNVRTKSLELAQQERENFRLDTKAAEDARIARLTEATNNATILAQSGVTAEGLQKTDPESYAALAQSVGGEEMLKAMFTLNRPTETVLDKRIEGGKYVIAYQNPIDGKVRIESVDLGLPVGYSKTIDAGNRILAIPDNWDGDPSKLVTINKGLTPSQAAAGGGGGGGTGSFSPAAQSWAQLIKEGGAKINNVPAKIRNEVAQALAASDPVLSRANRNALDQADTALTAITNIEDMLKGAGSGGTALQRGIFGLVPGTEARSVANNIQTLQALIGFDELARMRAASPTGGALGAITERELAFLQSVQGSLDPLQRTEDLKATLGRIRNSFLRIRAINSVNMTPAEYKAQFPDATEQELAELRTRREVDNSLGGDEVADDIEVQKQQLRNEGYSEEQIEQLVNS